MTRKFGIILFIFLWLVLQACASNQVTTATEPDFKSISDNALLPADIEMYKVIESAAPLTADRIDLAISIEGIEPDSLPISPSQPLETYQVGNRREFWTHNDSASQYNRIIAELMFISKHAYFWQDVNSEALNGLGETATIADWESAGESFDSSYERVRAIFGSEISPGLDGDKRLFVIHSDSIGNVGGYFGQADQLPAEVEPYSNVGQYFYISNIGSAGIASDYYKEVLAHEYQHMVLKNIDPNEDGWVNEGSGMFAQQVAGMRGHNFVAEYLIKPDQSLWYWSGGQQDYGQSYLFLNYLYEQLGEEFFKEMVANQANGFASIDQTVEKFDSSRTTDDLYADAITAAFFNDVNLAEGQYGYQIPPIPIVVPRYEFTSLPAVYEGSTQQYGGVDIISFASSGQATLTFTGDQRVKLIPAAAHSGEKFWWSSRYDSSFSTLTREVDLTSVSEATLKYWTWYDIEENFDYAYLMVSQDNGKHWITLKTTSSTTDDPNNLSLGNSLTGKSGDGVEATWIEETLDLSEFAGEKILIRFAMLNDLVVNEFGFAIDDISIAEIAWSDDFESATSDWEAAGFVLTHNYIPQVWRVRAVEQNRDGSITVRDVDVINGSGQLNIDFENIERLVVFIIGQTRYTTIPAFYSVEVK